MKSASDIVIRKMRVRVPGTSEEAGHALARSLREQLGELSTGCSPGHLGALRLRIPGEANAEPHAISEAITARIATKLTTK